MAIVRTDDWLKEHFDEPIKICEKLRKHFSDLSAKEIYAYLRKCNMYSPSSSSRETYTQLIKQDSWEILENLYRKYKKSWSGPEIPIYLFPVDQKSGLFRNHSTKKSGVSFPDKMFLFLSKLEDPKEIEALFVHEYHHVCRLAATKKELEEYTLIESIVMEGLAEYTVQKTCGKEYVGHWCGIYSERELLTWCERYVTPNLKLKKSERLHDELLYGKKGYPKMLGYSLGYHIVEKFYQEKNFSAKASFEISFQKFQSENFFH